MAEHSGIEWCDATFNPWWGCAKISPGCEHCYAESLASSYYPGRSIWGVDAERRTFGEAHWKNPLRWNTKAEKAGKRLRVFCASMADVFDNAAPPGARERLWNLIKATPYLDWLLLTKRIGNTPRMLPADWGRGYPNVWLGITVVNREEAARDIPKLRAIEARIRFLSIEPLIAPMGDLDLAGVRWVIVGGESGADARPMELAWLASVIEQCKAQRVKTFFKQFGRPQSNPLWSEALSLGRPPAAYVAEHDRIGKGGSKFRGREIKEFPT